MASRNAGTFLSQEDAVMTATEKTAKKSKNSGKIIKTEAWVVYLLTFRAIRIYEVEKCKSLVNSCAPEINARYA